MNPDNSRKYIHIHKTALLVIVLVIAAGLLGWRLGSSKTQSNNKPGGSTQTATQNNASTTAVKSLIGYTLPDNWKEGECKGVGADLIIPNGASADCSASPVAPIELTVDPGNTTDCNQLQGVTGVKKHVCISLYINGHKSLKASTEYPQSSTHTTDTTVSDYFINTGNGVVKVEYVYTSSNDFQMGFDQLATSVNVK